MAHRTGPEGWRPLDVALLTTGARHPEQVALQESEGQEGVTAGRDANARTSHCHCGVVTGDADVEWPPGARLSTVVVDDRQGRLKCRLAQPAAPPGDGCPVVAFGHGFVQLPQFYDSVLAAVASRGYYVIAPDTQTGAWPSHGRLADDLWRAAMWARDVAGWSGKGRGVVLAGHSMGAGAALLAASRHPEIDAVVALAALETRPRAGLEAIEAPSLFVVGSEDRVVPPARSRRLYDAMTAPSQWAVIRGGYHCGFLDRARWRDAGCDHGDLTRQAQLDITSRLVGDWLDATIRGAAFTARPGVDLEPAPGGS